MPTKLELLKERFRLLDHPFDPKLDPKANPAFSFDGRSLRQPLQIYRHSELRKFFVQVGPFKTASATAERFMAPWNGTQGPPAVIAYGPRHGGLDSIAGYAAALINEAAPHGAQTRFEKLQIISDSSVSFLEQLEFILRVHVTQSDIKAAVPLFDVAHKKEVLSEAVLTQLLTSLANVMEDAPWLVLFIRPVTWKRNHLVETYLDLLTNLRIAPIFMTIDKDVYRHFEDWKIADVLHLQVDGLNAEQGLELLQSRLTAFRADPPPEVPQSYPYLTAEVEKLFAEGEQPIGFVLDRYYGALEDKLTQVQKGGDASQIDWAMMLSNYDQELRKAAKQLR